MLIFLCALGGGLFGFLLSDFEPTGFFLGLVVGGCVGLVIKERRKESQAEKEFLEREAMKQAGQAGGAPSYPGAPGTGPAVPPMASGASAPPAGSLRSEVDELKMEAGSLWTEVDDLKMEVVGLRREVQRLVSLLHSGAPASEYAVMADRLQEDREERSAPVVEALAPIKAPEATAAYTIPVPTISTPVESFTEAAAQAPATDTAADLVAEAAIEPAADPVAASMPEAVVFAPESTEFFAQEDPTEHTAASTAAQADAQATAQTAAQTSEQAAAQALDAAATPRPEPAFTPPPPMELSLPAKILAWFTQGNTMVRVGVVVLFFGLAFLLKYAADLDLFPLEYRLISAGVAGLALLGLGWRLRRTRPDFAMPVQGGGVAVFYLTSLAAAKLYSTGGLNPVLPPEAAFGFMVGICFLSTMLAVLQRDQIMALLSFTGGRLAPLLLSTGEDHHVFLFSFYAMLTLGEIVILRFLSWRILPLVSFVFTLGVGAAWGALRYSPEFFPEAEIFLLIFFALYAGISVFQALKGIKDRLRTADVLMVFAVPLAAATMQWFLLRETEFGMAFSCLGLGAIYLGIATCLRNKTAEQRGFLFDAALSLGISALTLAVPFALSRDLTAAAWCVEGAALVWLGSRLRKPEGIAVGFVLQCIAGGLYLMLMGQTYLVVQYSGSDFGLVMTMFLNKLFIGGLLLTLSGLVSAHAVSRLGPEPEGSAETWQERLRLALWPLGRAYTLPAVWALFWWCVGGVTELDRHLDVTLKSALMGFVLLTTAGIFVWSRVPRMEKHLRAAVALVPVLLLMALHHAEVMIWNYLDPTRPWYELLIWLPALAAGLYSLRRFEAGVVPRPVLEWMHVLWIWTLCILVGAEFVAFVAREVPEGVWRVCAGGVVPAAALLLLSRLAPRLAWPVRAFERAWIGIAPLPLAGFLALWLFLCLWGRGDPAPLPYIPLLNPLDLTLALGTASLMVWVRTLRAKNIAAFQLPSPVVMITTVCLALFLWWNVALLRSLHHMGGFGFSLYDFLSDRMLQKCLAAGWVIFAAALLGLLREGPKRKAALIASVPVLALVFLWAVIADYTDNGGSLGMVPFLNPLDIIQIAGFALVVHVWMGMFRDCLGRRPEHNEKLIFGAFAAGMAVFWLHAVLLRTMHHWLGLPFDLRILLRSDQVQAAISVFWTLLAVGPILYSKHKKMRAAWFLGAGLLALTVCKLFLVDLSKLAGLERIISFIVVGLILLALGYLCPLPPKTPSREAEENRS